MLSMQDFTRSKYIYFWKKLEFLKKKLAADEIKFF